MTHPAGGSPHLTGDAPTVSRVRSSLAALVVPVLLLLGGCTADEPSAAEAVPSPFAECSDLTTPPAGEARATPPAGEVSATPPAGEARATPPAGETRAGGAGVRSALPDLGLTCFTGGVEIRLTELRGPAVVNLWGSWCPPCREELPAFQRLARTSGGALHVVGVNTGDERDSAAALGAHLGLTFPNLVDRDEKLRIGLSVPGLPATAFVDAQGRIRHVDRSGALDDATLGALVERHLGVRVPA
ncbi:redoxin domain-containing protein [Plantactinospora sp. GCM10030261]|uniref:TlpA family protein disulfide reductase n=1 Tax=Plantactinospora sp. GCM10030261 TaxID=3273420 RepID=UPI0036177E5A